MSKPSFKMQNFICLFTGEPQNVQLLKTVKLLLKISSLMYGMLSLVNPRKIQLLLYLLFYTVCLKAGIVADTFVSLRTPSGELRIAEGCEAAVLEINISGDVSEALEVRFVVGGTAQNGEDVNFIPPLIQLPAGDSILQLPILAVADGIAEGTEYLNIWILAGNLRDSFYLDIVDPIPVKPDLGQDKLLCSGEEFTFTVSEGAYVRYDWFSEEGIICLDCPELKVQAAYNLKYMVEATSKLGCKGRDTAAVILLPQVPPPQNLQCGTTTDQRLSIYWDLVPEALGYEVSIDGTLWQPTELPNFEWEGLVSGQEQQLRLRSLGACNSSAIVEIACRTLNCLVPEYKVEVNDPKCPGSFDGSVKILVDDPEQVLGYRLDGRLYATNFFSGLSPGNYSIEVVMRSGCNFLLSVFLEEPPAVDFTMQLLSAATCKGLMDGVAELSWRDTVLQADSIVWDNGEYGARANRLSVGMHEVTLYFPGFCPLRTNILVPFSDSLSAISEIHPVSCAGEKDGELTVLAINGVAPYQYDWNQGVFKEPNIKNLPPGLFSLEVRDARGCLLEDTFFLDEPEPLELSVKPTDVTCAGAKDGTAQSMVTGGRRPYAYFWSGGGRSESVSGLGPGPYRLFVQDSSGCRKNIDFEIFSPDSLNAVLSLRKPDCFGASNGAIEVVAKGGFGAYRIEWEDDSLAGFSRNQLTSGLYGFQLFDSNHCSISRIVNLEEPDSLNLAWEVSGETCPGNRDGSIALQVSGGTGNYRAIWQNGAVSMERHNLPASLQRVLIYDENACLKEAAIEVGLEDSLRVSFVMEEPSCTGYSDGSFGLEISGGTEPYAVNWQDGENLPQRQGLSAGLYAFTIADAGACRSSGQLNLGEPKPLEVSYELVAPSCNYSTDGSITLLAGGGVAPYTYIFENVEEKSSPVLAGLSEGTYPLLLKDNNGCRLADTIFLAAPEKLSLKKNVLEPLCFDSFDGQIKLEAGGGSGDYEFVWLGPEGMVFSGSRAENAGRGRYDIELRDKLGCLLTDSLFLDSPSLLQVDLSIENTVKEFIPFSPLVSASGGTGLYTFLWYLGDSLFHDCTNCLPPKVLPFQQQNLKLELYDENGCLAVASQKLEIVKNRDFFIPNVFSPNGDGNNDTFELFGFGQIRIEVFDIFDRWGNLVFSSPAFRLGQETRKWDGTQNGKKMPAGVYLWKLRAIFPDGFVDHKMGSVLLVR